jgi:hypothetical protein
MTDRDPMIVVVVVVHVAVAVADMKDRDTLPPSGPSGDFWRRSVSPVQ